MFYVTLRFSNNPTNANQYATRDEIPSFAKADAVNGNDFKYMGDWYTIHEGENPKAARVAAQAALPSRADAATPAQINYIRKLSAKCPSSAVAHWVKPNMTKREASTAINALQDIAYN